jgi:hypothetical protein
MLGAKSDHQEGVAMGAGAGGQGVRRMCVAFDLERYSAATDIGQIEKQRAMARLVDEACDRGALERAHWLKQEQGDGELALLPPGIDEGRVLTALWREFREGLHEYNRNVRARLRMRVAVHEGMTYIADNGFAGAAIVTVCRLRDCEEAKNALSAAKGDLVLIASDRIYRDVICGHDALDLPPTAFAETEIDIPGKGFRATAYIFSGTPVEASQPAQGGNAAMPQRAEGPSGRPTTSDGGNGGTTFNFGPIASMRDIVSGTVHHHYGQDE